MIKKARRKSIEQHAERHKTQDERRPYTWRQAVTAFCPGDYSRLMGYCNGGWEIRSYVSFCCFSKHKEAPSRENQRMMALQRYPDLKLHGSWQVWTDSRTHSLLCVHSRGWTRGPLVVNSVKRAWCQHLDVLWMCSLFMWSCQTLVRCSGDDYCHFSQTQLSPSVI